VYGSPLNALRKDTAFAEVISKPGGPGDEEMDRYAADAGLHSWQVELQFYGPERTCLANWEYAKERFARDIAGARAYEGESLKVPLTPRQLQNVDSPYPTSIRRTATQGIPSLGIWKIVGVDGHAGFFPIIPRTGEAIFEAQRVFSETLQEFDLPRFHTALTLPIHWHTFAFQMIFAPSISRSDPALNARMHQAMLKMIDAAAKHGWGDYRAAPIYQDVVADTYSFGNHALRRFREQLKDAVDPNGILAPGRGGVWPKRFRSTR
jgi:4-cresol dehydrogenase (hydroxylating)